MFVILWVLSLVLLFPGVFYWCYLGYVILVLGVWGSVILGVWNLGDFSVSAAIS